MSGAGRRNGVSPGARDLLSSPSIQERHAVKPRFAHIAVIGALAAAFALAGCGRKGPLEPPPGAAGSQPAQPAKPANSGMGFNPMAAQETPKDASFDAQGRPVAPANAPKKHLPIDWLID
jgi:predicted small lipoprotein YifL